MGFDLRQAQAAVGAELPRSTRVWGPDDVILYHLGIGADGHAPGPHPLRYVYERDLVVLPGYAATVAHATGTAVDTIAGLPIDRRMTVHADQEVVLHGPIPVAGESVTTGRVIEVADLGRTAVIRTETETRVDGELVFSTRFGVAVRGAGGFGGARPRPLGSESWPDGRGPDRRFSVTVGPRQAMIYRLLGDHNPLHIDPEHARAVGFSGVIVHGLSTYGTVLRGLVDGWLGGDVAAVGAFRARFTDVVLPGDELELDVWEVGSDLAVSVRVPKREVTVLSRGWLIRRR